MAGLSLEMLKGSLDAFVKRDAAAARALIPKDKEIDVMNKQLQRELAARMVSDSGIDYPMSQPDGSGQEPGTDRR